VISGRRPIGILLKLWKAHKAGKEPPLKASSMLISVPAAPQTGRSAVSENVNSGLVRLVEENAKAIAGLERAVAELRKSIAGLRLIVEENSRAIAELKERSEENLKAIAELRKSIAELRPIVEENSKAIAKLKERSEENLRATIELRASLEAERELRRGEVGRLEGRIVEVELLMSLRDWCSAHGLHVERLPRDPYRADAVVEGEALVALVEVAKTGSEADVRQLVEAARIYETLRGDKPNALVLYIYAEKPPEELVRECSKHGIIVDNSPKRIARRLAELEEELRAT